MATTPTLNYGWDKPNPFEEEDTWGELLNIIFDEIDAQVKVNETAIDAVETGLAGKQPLDADLTAIAAIAGTTGLLRKTAANTWSLDTTDMATQAELDAGLALKAGLADANVFTANQTIQNASEAASVNPLLILYRNNTTPAAADVIGGVQFQAKDSLLNDTNYAFLKGTILDPTDGSEDGGFIFQNFVGGVFTTTMQISQGLHLGSAVDMGAGTVNALGVYENGVRIGASLLGADLIQTGTANHTLVLADAGRVKRFNTSSATGPATLTVPDNATVPFPVGTFIDVTWEGTTPSVTIVPSVGVTVRALNDNMGLSGRYSWATLHKVGADAWILENKPYQPIDADLTAIAAIVETSGLLRKTAANTWALDTTVYANDAATTAALAGKQPLDADLTAIAALAGTSGLLRKTAADTWTLDTATYAITGANTFTGDQIIQSVGATSNVGPLITLERNSPTPADADVIGGILFNGYTAALTGKSYAAIKGQIISVAAGAETGGIIFQTPNAGGAITTRMAIGPGVVVGTGTDLGIGTVNASAGFYDNGTKVGTSQPMSNMGNAAAYTLAPTDAGTARRLNSTTVACVITLPDITTVPGFTAGMYFDFVQTATLSAGSHSFVAGGVATIISLGSKLKLAGLGARVRVQYSTASGWVASGDLIA